MLLLSAMPTSPMQNALLTWYAQNHRALPWRENRDPYRIWISETMLQQTTTTAVIPFFLRFVERFPTLNSLAAAPLAQVVESWAGLGYYSRARNLHKAAIALAAGGGFPQCHAELLEYPGFGPYTARSVASLAFDAPVGVVDGNVIRVLARVEGQDWQWWQGKTRARIQERADAWVHEVSSYTMNQALMELGRTICLPKAPVCGLCPLRAQCVSWHEEKIALRPRPKPRRQREIWLWEPQILIQRQKILLRKNLKVPFLRGQWLVPGKARRLKVKPATFDYRHSITHHDIFVTLKAPVLKIEEHDKWVRLQEIRQYIPASLVQKAVDRAVATR